MPCLALCFCSFRRLPGFIGFSDSDSGSGFRFRVQGSAVFHGPSSTEVLRFSAKGSEVLEFRGSEVLRFSAAPSSAKVLRF